MKKLLGILVLTVAHVQRELIHWKISQALCGEPASTKGRSVARCPRPRFLKLIKQREQIYHLQL